MLAIGPRADHDVAYLTDVEGQAERLDDFVRDNPCVSADAAGALVVRAGATFVFGGDAIDRGDRGRAVVNRLLDVKRRQPDQVVLLAGNRDLNKLRLWRELQGHPLARVPDDVKTAPRPVLLRWIFNHTMGAQEAFEHRRAELAFEGRGSDDEAVVDSYLEDLDAGGPLRAYLSSCQLAYRAGGTLFVHGGVAAEALTHVPFTTPTTLADFDVDAWAQALNAFYADQLEAFDQGRMNGDAPAWADIVAYQAPRKGKRGNPGSVVYGRMADALNNPTLPDGDVVDALQRAGIHRLLVGHTPSGDLPTVVRRSGPHVFESVTCDNSRSRVQTASRVFVRDAALRTVGNTVLDDGRALRVDLTLSRDDTDTPVGKRTADGCLVKGLVDDDALLFRYGEAFAFFQTARARSAVPPSTLSDPLPVPEPE